MLSMVKNKKLFPVFIILVFLAGIVVGGGFGMWLKYKKIGNGEIITTQKSGIEIYLFDNKLLEEEENLIITDTLTPAIKIKTNKKTDKLQYVSID